MNKTLIPLLALLALAVAPLHADGMFSASSNDTRLHDALKKAAVELRAAQDQIAQLNADKAKSDAAAKAAQDALDAQTKQAETDKAASDAANAKLASQVIAMQRLLDDAVSKNKAMYSLAKEILDRYVRAGLGDYLAAKEPFTQISKVKLENFAQDYGDKLTDNRLKVSQSFAPAPAPAATPKASEATPAASAPADPTPSPAPSSAPAAADATSPASSSSPASTDSNSDKTAPSKS